MKKYTTKPIDFTGCHPVIAEHLKRGEAIECFVWDEEGESKVKDWVYGYAPDTIYNYKTKADKYACAEPIQSKGRRIMPPERAIPVLIANGYEFDTSGGLVGHLPNILPVMFPFMGRVLDGEAGCFNWPPCIIEECDE